MVSSSFSLFSAFGIEGGRLRFPASLFPSFCGLHAGLTLLVGHPLLHLVLFRMPGMRTGMSWRLYLLMLYLILGMRCLGHRLMIFCPFGARMRRPVFFGRIGSPAFLGRGLLRILSRCLGGRAVGGRGSCRLYRASQGDEIDVHCSQYTSTRNISSCFFIWTGLISVCSYSFWRRSNYF